MGLAVLVLAGLRPARAQVGPIEPIIIPAAKPSATLAALPDIGADYLIPVEITVAADGAVKDVIVSTPSGNAAADRAAISFMKEQHFLPALDDHVRPVQAKVLGAVEVKASSSTRQLKASLKPPNIPTEIERVRKMSCKDFVWEIDRLRNQGASPDLTREIMPWLSLRVYMLDKHLPKDAEPAYLRRWPQALAEAEAMCRSAPGKSYYQDTLVLIIESLPPN